MLPDNQLGLEGASQETVPGQVSPKDKTRSRKVTTAAKTRAKPKGVATPQRKLARKGSVVEATGESKPGTDAKTSESKKGMRNKPTMKDKPSKQKNTTEKGIKQNTPKKVGDGKTTGATGKQPTINKTKQTEGDCPEPEHVNPGGPASSSGIKRKPHDSGSEPKRAKQVDAKKSTPAPANPPQDPVAVVAGLQRANTTEQEEKDAKRKAYKARKQRFYNSLSSNDLNNRKQKS